MLDERGISYEVTGRKAVSNMAEAADIDLPHPECEAKDLFARDKKKRDCYLVTVKGDARVDLKEFREKNGTRALSFASPDELRELMGEQTAEGACSVDQDVHCADPRRSAKSICTTKPRCMRRMCERMRRVSRLACAGMYRGSA